MAIRIMGNKILIFILAVVVVVLGYFYFKGKADMSQLLDLLNKKADSAKMWKDSYGHEHATLQQEEMDAAVAKVLHGKELDSLAKLLHTSAGKIRSNTVTHDDMAFDVKPGTVDTAYFPDTSGRPRQIRRLTGIFDDSWLHFNVTLGDSNRMQGYATDTTGIVQYVKGFFNAKTYLDVTHRSPYVHTNSITSYAVKEPSGGFQVVIFAGAGYDVSNMNLNHPRPLFGLGIAKTLFSFGNK